MTTNKIFIVLLWKEKRLEYPSSMTKNSFEPSTWAWKENNNILQHTSKEVS